MAKEKDQNESGKVYIVSNVRLTPKDLHEIYGNSSIKKTSSTKKPKKSFKKPTDQHVFNFGLLADVK